MGKIWKMVVTVIYAVGVAIVLILLSFVTFRPHTRYVIGVDSFSSFDKIYNKML